MATLGKIIGFVTTTKPEAARAFYGDTLGFHFAGEDDFALVFDAHGTMLRVGKAREFTPAHGTVLGWEVENIQSAVEELSARGVKFEQFNMDFMKQDAAGIWKAPGGDQVAWFRDPDRNVLSVSQHVH